MAENWICRICSCLYPNEVRTKNPRLKKVCPVCVYEGRDLASEDVPTSSEAIARAMADLRQQEK